MAGNQSCTGCSLSDITPLCMPWQEVNGRRMPQFSHRAAMLSYELAASAYDLQLDPWRDAGWRDFSYQVDNTLITGPNVNPTSGGGLSTMISDYFQRLAQSRLKRLNPISQLRGALRQREKADTCKAIVMLRPLYGGRYLVAIGFMGTGKRIYDWFSNFRLEKEEGVHAGFLQLTKEFEKNCDEICFPETAAELGLARLTLNDILEECRRPGSRFCVWLAGHSQGGAVMQLFALREIRRGFLRQNMLGYGFASPSVVYDNPCCDLGSFPLFHIINADDSFPRMGARLHVGRCRVFLPDDDMRVCCYGETWKKPVFQSVLHLLHMVCDSGSAFLCVLAMLGALQTLPAEEAVNVLNGLIGSLIPDMLLHSLGSRREDMVRALIQRAKQGYQRATGEAEPPRELLLPLEKRIAQMILDYGSREFSSACLQALSLPHRLRRRAAAAGTAPYLYIVTERFEDLRQKCWLYPASASESLPLRGDRRIADTRFAAYSRAREQRARALIKRRLA